MTRDPVFCVPQTYELWLVAYSDPAEETNAEFYTTPEAMILTADRGDIAVARVVAWEVSGGSAEPITPNGGIGVLDPCGYAYFPTENAAEEYAKGLLQQWRLRALEALS